MRELVEIRTIRELSSVPRPLAVAALGLGLVALVPGDQRCSLLILAALAAGACVLAWLPIRLPAQELPIGILTLGLAPAWLLCGTWAAAALAVAGAATAWPLRRPLRLPPGWQVAASLAGVGLGGLLGALAGFVLPEGLPALAGRATVFALGLWGGQVATEWLGPDREAARPSWLIQLLTDLVLAPPAIFLAEIGVGGELLPFAASLGLALGLVALIRTATNSETRTVELEEQAASSADARQHLELIVDHAPEALFGMDREGNVRWLNRTAIDWLGERAEQAVGRPAREAVPVRSPNGGMLDHASLLQRAAEEGRPLHEEGLLEGGPGAPQRVVASFSAVGEPDGEDLGLVLLRDASVVTESLREQEELAVHLSHELRAPLTTILGYAQLMSSVPNSSANTQTEFAKRISESGDYMLRLVNNLLDLGRIARDGAEDLPISTVDVAALTRDVVEAHRLQASDSGQELTYEGPPGPLELETADLALRQVLTNLLANAVKYTPPGGKVRVTLTDEPTAVTWQVIDTGIGLSPEEQDRLFTKFFRSQRPEARLIKGTGLGLALTKALVDRLDGSITVQSTVDQGSTFTVRLPRTHH